MFLQDKLSSTSTVSSPLSLDTKSLMSLRLWYSVVLGHDPMNVPQSVQKLRIWGLRRIWINLLLKKCLRSASWSRQARNHHTIHLSDQVGDIFMWDRMSIMAAFGLKVWGFINKITTPAKRFPGRRWAGCFWDTPCQQLKGMLH